MNIEEIISVLIQFTNYNGYWLNVLIITDYSKEEEML